MKNTTTDGSKTDKNIATAMDEIFSRRCGLKKALTVEADELTKQIQPETGTVFLHGLTTGEWELRPQALDLLPDYPQPLGINVDQIKVFKEREWLRMVAIHCDAWLMAMTSHCCWRFKFDAAKRQYLFKMISRVSTLYEVVKEYEEEAEDEGSDDEGKKAEDEVEPAKKKAEGKKSVAEGKKSVAEGKKSVAEGKKSVAEGKKSVAEGKKSVAEGCCLAMRNL